jgi:glyoxylase I family protein
MAESAAFDRASAIGGVHHLAVVVADLARAEAFYVGVLGLPVRNRWSDEAGVPRALWVALDSATFLAIEGASRAEPVRDPGSPGYHCLALRIAAASREAWRAHLAEAGFPVQRETAYTLYTFDPDRNLVALSHHPDAASNER